MQGYIDEVMGALHTIVSSNEKVLFAYLFGSVARADDGPLSDVDTAFYVNEELSGKERSRLRLELIMAVSQLLDRDDIDVIVVNDAPPELVHRIMRGMTVCPPDHESRRREFEVLALNRYMDRKPFLRIFRQARMRRIEEGTYGR